MTADEKICFVISPIGEPDSEDRKHSDKVLKHIIRPAAAECGYKAIRADEIVQPGIITSQVIRKVMEAPMVVADLTGRNPNVFYELALRHALQKPLVQIIQATHQIPFDVVATRTVKYDLQDPDSVVTAREEIVKQIRSVEKDAKQVDNPISVAINLELLRQSGNPVQEQLAEVLKGLAEMRAAIEQLASRIPSLTWGLSDLAPGATRLISSEPPPRRQAGVPPSAPPIMPLPAPRSRGRDQGGEGE